MPRIGRIVFPNYPHHIVRRGHDRNELFVEAVDYRYYLESLSEFKEVFDIKIYAYCLMTNHVHLLLESSTHSGIGQIMALAVAWTAADVVACSTANGDTGRRAYVF